MQGIVWVLSVCLLAVTVTRISCITNGEFIHLILPYASEIEEYDADSDLVAESGGVIALPGNLDDELDMVYIFEKLGVLADDDVIDGTGGVSRDAIAYPWLPGNIKQQQQQYPGLRQPLGLHFGCTCTKDECSCCAKHTFVFNVIFKTYRYPVSACAGLQLFTQQNAVELSFKLNDRRVFHHRISHILSYRGSCVNFNLFPRSCCVPIYEGCPRMKNPPHLCFPLPGTLTLLKVCLGLYDINLSTKHVCVAVIGMLDLRIHKFKLRFKLGCFKIPLLDKDAFLLLTKNPDFFRVTRMEGQQSRDFEQSRDFVLGHLQEE